MNRTESSSMLMASRRLPLFLIVIAFGVVLFSAAASLPLRVDEVLQIAALKFHSHTSLLASVAQTPGAAPLNFLFQAALASVIGYSALADRLLSIVFALATLIAFWRLAVRCSIVWILASLCLFAALPIHFVMASLARPYEQALFFLILSTIWFLRTSAAPNFKSASFYAALLLLTVYSEPFAFLPAIGYLLFFLRFINRKQERRAFWFLLPATIAPALLFLPYYVWAAQHANQNWIYPNSPSGALYLQLLHDFVPDVPGGDAVSICLFLCTVAVIVQSVRPAATPLQTSTRLFPLAGGVVTSVVIVLLLDSLNGSPVWPNHLLWVVPETIILFFGVLGWLIRRKSALLVVAGSIVISLTLMCVAGDAVYIRSAQRTDLKREADAIRLELTGDSCLVFVSEGLSRFLFVVFQPQLQQHECLNFAPERAVLAIHPFVSVESQENAISFFQGLNFSQTKRTRVGGGQIIVMQQNKD